MKTIKRLTLILGCALAIGGVKAQTVTFNYTGSLQTWTVPCGVTSATITAFGGAGGAGTATSNNGLGAEIVGTFTTVPGNILDIVVGQQGLPNNEGSGGGGTFVWNSTSTTLPMVAAGGGGGSYQGGAGGNGSATTTTTVGTGPNGSAAGGAGGTGGTGGTCGSYGGGGAGAGWLTNGGVGGSCGGFGGGAGGNTALTGGAGGVSNVVGGCIYSSAGGYGGGGASTCYASGGGGGYNGGGGAIAFVSGGNGAGGGGSYNGGTNQNNVAGAEAGNGSVTITWVLPTAPVVTANVVSNVSCNGGSNGSAHGTVTGGSIPYTYLWTPSAQTNATATGLSAGTYTIGVSDACGNTASASVILTQPAVLVVTATTSSNVTCNAGSNGATASTVSGGTTPYTYSWTGGSTNTTATGLSAGTYTLNVTDMNGCTASASTVVTQPNVLSDTSFTTANVLCHGDSSGSAFTMASGGTMPYTYLWTPGGGTTDTAVGLKAGSYTVTVSDACGASATASVSVTQPSALSITSHSAPDNGHGVGTAVVSVSGGVGPYTYLWAGGKTTDSIGGLTKGTYCVDVKDANGCTDSLCVVVKTTAGIDGITGNSSQIIVYPNPNNGQFTIASSISGASTVEIYNILGEKVFTKNLSTTKGTNQINVSNQPNGVYLYRVISESGDLLGQGKITLQK